LRCSPCCWSSRIDLAWLGWNIIGACQFYSPYSLFPSGSLQVAGRLNHRCIPDRF
jgi:hypothetical protein